MIAHASSSSSTPRAWPERLAPVDLARLAYKVGGWRGADLGIAVRIMLGESGGNVGAVGVNDNGTVDRGIWQINSRAQPWVKDSMAFDPYEATICARRIFERDGWAPWRGSDGTAHASRAREAAAAIAKAGLQSEAASGRNVLIALVLTLLWARYSHALGAS